MNTNNTQMGAEPQAAAQILNNLTLAQAYAYAATADKAAYVVELLGVKSIHSPLFVEMEDAIEERFHQLRVADNRDGRGDSAAHDSRIVEKPDHIDFRTAAGQKWRIEQCKINPLAIFVRPDCVEAARRRELLEKIEGGATWD